MPRRTALLIVDVQNDFCPGGSLAVPDGDRVIEPLNIMIERAVKEDWLVVVSRDWHPRETSHFAEFGGKWPSHCVKETHGAEFHRDLILSSVPHHVVSKGCCKDEDAYSAFQGYGDCVFAQRGESGGASLNVMLRGHDVTMLYVGGLATDYCVKATVLDACRFSFKTQVLANACRAVELNEGDGRRAVMEMMRAGAEISFEPYDSMIMRIPKFQRKGRP